MSVGGFVKAGWFLVGAGFGASVALIFMQRELDKPIGEIEEYVPLDDRKDSNEEDEDFENYSEDEGRDNSIRRKGSKGSSVNQKDVSHDRSDSNRLRGRNGRKRPSRHNDRKEDGAEFSSVPNEILDNYKGSHEHVERASKKREGGGFGSIARRSDELDQQGTRYSRMYQEEAINEALHVENAHRESRNSYDVVNRVKVDLSDDESDELYYDVDEYEDFEDYDLDDGPEDDYVDMPVFDADLHDQYTLERVSENVEIFLGDNPQDFSTLIFYEGDNTLCDEDDTVIGEKETKEVIGFEALSRLIQGGPGAENGVIFVHNLKTSLNYEIVLDAGSYQDTPRGRFESHLFKDGGVGGDT